MRVATGRSATALNLARAGYGLLQLVLPAPMDRRLLGHAIDARVRTFSRILGVRQLGQALGSGWTPSYPVLALGVEVDLVHAATLAAFGVGDPQRRRAASLDVLIAASFALAGALAARAATPQQRRSGPIDALRQQTAHRLAAALVPGYPRPGQTPGTPDMTMAPTTRK